MIIKKYTWRHRRDFRADMKCEHCGHIEENVSGYDDRNFHENVIPDIECEECGESSNSKRSEDTTIRRPKYPEGMQL